MITNNIKWKKSKEEMSGFAERFFTFYPINGFWSQSFTFCLINEFSLPHMGHVVAQWLRHCATKPEGCGIDSRWCHLNFSLK
jgi:hypothetical protein